MPAVTNYVTTKHNNLSKPSFLHLKTETMPPTSQSYYNDKWSCSAWHLPPNVYSTNSNFYYYHFFSNKKIKLLSQSSCLVFSISVTGFRALSSNETIHTKVTNDIQITKYYLRIMLLDFPAVESLPPHLHLQAVSKGRGTTEAFKHGISLLPLLPKAFSLLLTFKCWASLSVPMSLPFLIHTLLGQFQSLHVTLTYVLIILKPVSCPHVSPKFLAQCLVLILFML